MGLIEGNCREVCEATEFVTIVTSGDDEPALRTRPLPALVAAPAKTPEQVVARHNLG